jgi:hypothetical protein
MTADPPHHASGGPGVRRRAGARNLAAHAAAALLCVAAVEPPRVATASSGPQESSPGREEPARRAGYIESVNPAERTLVLKEVGGGRPGRLHVRMRNAEIVRVWRDPADPQEWRERATTIYQWPVGTLVVVVGRPTSAGPVEASRIEIPKITTE